MRRVAGLPRRRPATCPRTPMARVSRDTGGRAGARRPERRRLRGPAAASSRRGNPAACPPPGGPAAAAPPAGPGGAPPAAPGPGRRGTRGSSRGGSAPAAAPGARRGGGLATRSHPALIGLLMAPVVAVILVVAVIVYLGSRPVSTAGSATEAGPASPSASPTLGPWQHI